MIHHFLIEPQNDIAFENEAELIEKCKEWGLLSEKASKSKSFTYKRSGLNLACTITGYVDRMTAVITFEDGQKHCIHPSYLKEMQAANYGLKVSAVPEESLQADNADIVELDTLPEAVLESEPKVEEELVVTPSEEPKAAPKSKAKKEKAPKLELPEEKVTMIATVKEFTTVPNNFSDTEDEVVIYEAVAIIEPELDVGDAWSSHSATLKKFELEIGDTIHFEGKIVAKKLSKHPIPYKINNPAKIQKEKAE
ncbi:hypothetical protein [Paenibacillus luteus]|uniref:hypothetical protein n=1 Tax=Paenibacillus luteus TaxID=2545753 RepID=UPI001143B902|nr:hypothetical protein [Paenibacillus luteus]